MSQLRLSFVTLALGLFGLAGSSLASNLTSSNAADVVASTSGTAGSVYISWESTLTGVVNDNISFSGSSSCGNGSTGCLASILNDGMFSVTGSAGVIGSSITTSTAYPLAISMLNTPSLTGLELELSGIMSVTLTLSDGSTVTTGSTNYASPTFVTFDSPLQITTATISSGTTGALYDLSWGTANPADLPTQPGSGGSGSSATPEAASFLLMGGGLLLMSLWLKRQQFSF